MSLFCALALIAAMATQSTAANPESLHIIDRPIRFDAERLRLTVAYRRHHQDPTTSDARITPRMIILHHTGGGSLQSAWATFDPIRAREARPELASAGEVNVSAHYLVDRDGTIYRLMPDSLMARHCIGLNHVAIGIENVGEPERYPLTGAQVTANAALVRNLVRRHPTITHLIGHHEYRRMEGHVYFLERDARYRNHKPDPGFAFMAAVRARLGDLNLSEAPGTHPSK